MVDAILGIDIGKTKYQATLLMGEKRMRRSFRNHADDFGTLTKWLAKHKVTHCHACLEATGSYWEEIALFLHGNGFAISVVNPARIRAHAGSKLSRNKTDKLDADLIADFCVKHTPEMWTPPPVEVQTLQALVRRLEDLVAMRTQEQNRLKSGSPGPLSGASGETVRQQLGRHITYLTEQIEECEAQIRDHIDRHPRLREDKDLLVTIPGISHTTAVKLLAANIQSFRSTRALSAYAGLSPQAHQSGSSVRHRPRLSKIGPPALRHALYWPAISARTHNPLVRELCQRLAQRNKPSMVQIGAAMRKLLCLALGVLKSRKPFDPNYAVSAVSTI
jgi:transposase